MKKQEILDHIQEAIRREESATGIFMKHLSSVILRSDLEKNKITQVRTIITFLISENKKHKTILESLFDKISKEQIDVY